MRRSAAPSVREAAKRKKIEDLFSTTCNTTAVSDKTTWSAGTETIAWGTGGQRLNLHTPPSYSAKGVRSFQVLWNDCGVAGQYSCKNKGTCELFMNVGRCVLRNEQGCVVASSVQLDLENVAPGRQYQIGNKEIEILHEIQNNNTRKQQSRGQRNAAEESNTTSAWSAGKLFFKIVWRELTARKRKTWKGDGTAEVRVTDKRIILKDHTGKFIGSGKMPADGVVEQGVEMVVGGKEIELLEQIKDQSEYWAMRRLELDERGWGTEAASALAEAEEPKKPKGSFVFRPILNLPPLKLPKRGCLPIVRRRKDVEEDVFVLPPPKDLTDDAEMNFNERQLVEVRVSPHLTRHLRPHQREGVAFLYTCLMGFRRPNCYGCILADEMGLGKTLQCLTVAQTLLRGGPFGGERVLQRVLLVTPSSLVANWNNEIHKWLQEDRLFAFVVGGERKLCSYARQQHMPFVIVSYESLSAHVAEFQNMRFDLLVCDEGHRLKNQSTKIFCTLNELDIRRRLILTGTPIQNDLNEFFSLADFVNPGLLGTQQEFRRHFERPLVEGRHPEAPAKVKSLADERSAELSAICGDFLLRRTQEVNRSYLPSKQEYICFVKPCDLQLSLLQRALELYRKRREAILQDMSPLQIISVLKKICNHPSLIGHTSTPNALTRALEKLLPGWAEMGPFHSAKLEVVQHLLTVTAVERREKCVLVSNHTKTLNMLQGLCDFLQLRCLRLDGNTPLGERQSNVEQFNAAASSVADGETEDSPLVFLLSTKAGGVGLNLIGASRLILFDQDWNPATDAQAVSRIWRDGQQRNVQIYRLITAGCIEEKIFQRQVAKMGLSGSALGIGGNEATVKFSPEQLLDLFSLQSDYDSCQTHDSLNCPCQGDGQNTCAASADAKGLNELMGWQHYGAPFQEQFLEEAQLSGCGDTLMYVFLNRTNAL